MPSKRELFGNDCIVNLAMARDLKAQTGAALLDAQTVEGVARLTERGRELARQMAQMGLGRVCAACAAKPDGGCCSRAIANESDTVLLLMNLLAGVPVEVIRDNGHECCFLGALGCALAFKPIFCLNYDCADLKAICPRESLSRYERLRGLLLQEQWRLEQHLLERLKAIGVVR